MANETEIKQVQSSEARPQWSSHLGFILASLGSAVGLGNIWRFPYVMGKYGGGAFLLAYMVLMCFICIVPLVCELFLGKKFKLGVVGSYTSINKKLNLFGWLNVFSILLIAGYYFVVGGWIINYTLMYIVNRMPSDSKAYFYAFTSGDFMPLFFAIVFLVATVWFPYRGINKGIEKANKIMMPLFLLMLLFLVITAQTLPGAKEGLEFIFKPDFSKFNGEMLLVAFGQALFSLSIGMGAMITYGSYLKKETNLVESSYTLIFGETLIAVSAGLMIFPAVFSFGYSPDEGFGLAFVTLPKVFSQLPFGSLIAITFFILLLFAALTSSISMVETVIASVKEQFKMTREKATILVGLILIPFIIPATFSFGLLKNVTFFDKTFFGLFDYFSGTLLLPFNTLIMCCVVGWIVKPSQEIVNNNKILYFIFNILLKFILPIMILILFLSGIGLIKI